SVHLPGAGRGFGGCVTVALHTATTRASWAKGEPRKVSDTAQRPVEVDRVIIRFAGDSGDGMQLTGDRFTNVSALVGNDLATLPEFPAEIRAPAGTLAGVSAFQ